MNDEQQFAEDCHREIIEMAQDEQLLASTKHWMRVANHHKYSYHFRWLGRPIIQYPQDIVALQELVWQIKPDLIIETGIARGGSLILHASLLALLDLIDARDAGLPTLDLRNRSREVLGIDIDIRPHNRGAIEAHPLAHYITLLEGSSTDRLVLDAVKSRAEKHKTILVLLDSNHTYDHVLAELEAYAPLTSVGSYCVVFDTIIEDLPAEASAQRPWAPGNNPKTAVYEYLKFDSRFEVDKSLHDKLQISVAPDGYLKRIP